MSKVSISWAIAAGLVGSFAFSVVVGANAEDGAKATNYCASRQCTLSSPIQEFEVLTRESHEVISWT
jgi:hypothetical protein